MSKTNHRRNFKASKDSERYRSGGRSGYVNSLSTFSDTSFSAGWGCSDNANGHSGFSKVKRGAKRFVRQRIRFHENAQTRKEANAQED